MIHVSFTLFVDYLMAPGPARVSMIQDHVDPGTASLTATRRSRRRWRTSYARGCSGDPALLGGGARRKARANLLALADGFMAGQADIVGWSEPTILPIQIGSDCSVDVNPEIGGMVGGVPTWIKLYQEGAAELRPDDPHACGLAARARHRAWAWSADRGASGRRVRRAPGAICTPTLNEAVAARVASYTKLVTAEGVGYGVLRSLAEKELVAMDERGAKRAQPSQWTTRRPCARMPGRATTARTRTERRVVVHHDEMDRSTYCSTSRAICVADRGRVPWRSRAGDGGRRMALICGPVPQAGQ